MSRFRGAIAVPRLPTSHPPFARHRCWPGGTHEPPTPFGEAGAVLCVLGLVLDEAGSTALTAVESLGVGQRSDCPQERENQ